MFAGSSEIQILDSFAKLKTFYIIKNADVLERFYESVDFSKVKTEEIEIKISNRPTPINKIMTTIDNKIQFSLPVQESFNMVKNASNYVDVKFHIAELETHQGAQESRIVYKLIMIPIESQYWFKSTLDREIQQKSNPNYESIGDTVANLTNNKLVELNMSIEREKYKLAYAYQQILNKVYTIITSIIRPWIKAVATSGPKSSKNKKSSSNQPVVLAFVHKPFYQTYIKPANDEEVANQIDREVDIDDSAEGDGVIYVYNQFPDADTSAAYRNVKIKLNTVN